MLTDAIIVAALLLSALLILLDILLWRHLASSPKPDSHLLQIFAHSSEAVFLARPVEGGGFIVTEMNAALAALLPQAHEGWQIGPAPARQDASGSDFVRKLPDALQRTVREGQPVEYETAYRHPADNREVHCRVRLLPVAKAGAVTHVLGFITDTSPYRLAEQLLYERAQESRMLVEQSPDTIARYDQEGHRVYANPAFHRLALTASLPGRVAVAAEYCGDGYRAKLGEALESGQEDEFECTWPAATGTLTSLIRLVPEFDAAGKVSGVLSIGRDISALKATENHLRESRALLRELSARREEEMQRVRKEVAREMHEDYGQRLSVLRMHLSMLHMRFGRALPELGVQLEETQQLLDETIRHMREIVSFIHPSVLNMSVASALEWLAEDVLVPAGIQYEVRVTEAADALDETVTSLVFRLAQHALSNVVRHAQATRVSLLLEPHGDGYRMEVRDNGRGFDLDREKKDSLGMVAMEELAHRLNGEIVFLSSPDKGTVIEVCFPERQGAGEAV
jgi:signal transduction histidine kinase